MKRFTTEQKVYDIAKVKVGGQPGELPTFIIGSIFWLGQPMVQDANKGIFNPAEAEKIINTMQTQSDMTGVPFALDVVGTTEEAFGTWAWTVSPKASGRCCLKASLCAREVDASGPGAVTAFPDQIVKVRIRDNFWLTLASFVRAVLLMLAGSGLTMTAWYAWKVAVRLH